MMRTAQEDLSDEVLSARSRNGDDLAFSHLYRRHIAIASRTARCILHSSNDVDDVVAEAFTGVLAALRNGKGPRDNFRAYLLACVRNRCYVRRRPPTPIVDEHLESLTPVFEDPERYVEADTVARAFASLRPRWQRTLWLTEVEQLSAADVAAEMQLAPNATAALARRARQAFAAAYLSEHLSVPPASAACAEVGPKLGAYVRDDLGTAERATVSVHIAGCASCSQAVDQLDDLNGSLRSLQGPSVGLAAAGAGAGGLVATSTLGSGVFAAIGGASLFAKVAAAILLVVPTAAIVSRRLSASADAGGTHAAVVVGLPAPQRAGTVSVGGSPGGAGASGATAPAPTGGSAQVGADVPVSPSVSVGVAAALAGPAAEVLAAGGALGVPAVSTLPVSAPAITLPPSGLPGVTLPGATVPGVTVPGIGLPGVTIPGVTVAAVPLPIVTVPGLSIPPVTVSPITLPTVTVAPVTVPALPIAPVTSPSATVPPITIAPVTIAPVTTVPVTIPAVTLPPIGVPPLG